MQVRSSGYIEYCASVFADYNTRNGALLLLMLFSGIARAKPYPSGRVFPGEIGPDSGGTSTRSSSTCVCNILLPSQQVMHLQCTILSDIVSSLHNITSLLLLSRAESLYLLYFSYRLNLIC